MICSCDGANNDDDASSNWRMIRMPLVQPYRNGNDDDDEVTIVSTAAEAVRQRNVRFVEEYNEGLME